MTPSPPPGPPDYSRRVIVTVDLLPPSARPSIRLPTFVSIDFLFSVTSPSYRVVLDTGASISLISRALVKQHRLDPIAAPKATTLHGIAGSQTLTHYVDVPALIPCDRFTLARFPMRLWIVNDFGQSAIFATDFIHASDMHIDVPRSQVVFRTAGLTAPITTHHSAPQAFYAATDFTLPPCHVSPITLARPPQGATSRFTPVTTLIDVLPSAPVSSATSAVLAYNNTPHPRTIPAGALLDHAQLFPTIDACHFVGHATDHVALADALDGQWARKPLPQSARGHIDEEDPFPLAAAPYRDTAASADSVDVNTTGNITAAQTRALCAVVHDFPHLWTARLGLLSTGEQMTLPTPSLDADPHAAGRPRLYKLSATDRLAVDTVFDVLAKTDRLAPLPHGSPVGWPVFVVWRNNKPRPVVDLRRLNALCTPDVYPLPSSDDVRDRIADCSFMTSQMPIAAADQWKTAMLTHRGFEAPPALV